MQSFYLSLDCATFFVAKHFIQSSFFKDRVRNEEKLKNVVKWILKWLQMVKDIWIGIQEKYEATQTIKDNPKTPMKPR